MIKTVSNALDETKKYAVRHRIYCSEAVFHSIARHVLIESIINLKSDTQAIEDSIAFITGKEQ